MLSFTACYGFSAREQKQKIEFVFLCVSRLDIITLIVTNPEVLLAGGLHEQFRGLCAHGVIFAMLILYRSDRISLPDGVRSFLDETSSIARTFFSFCGLKKPTA